VITIAGPFSTGIGILIFLLILGLVVFVHELGHFLMARRAGIFVEEFAMGMGPKIVAIRGKKKAQSLREGEDDVTLYTLRLLPLGGFCKMRGMEEAIADDPEAMNNKSVFDRILVIAGGSFMNFLLAVILFFALLFLNGYTTPIVSGIAVDRPAYEAGLQVGDRITHINGSRVYLWENFRFIMDTSAGRELDFRIIRDGERMNLAITPVMDTDGVFRIGMNPSFRYGPLVQMPEGMTDYYRTGVGGSLVASIEMIGFHIRTPFRLLARLVTRQPMPEGAEVQSVIGIGAQVTEIFTDTVEHGMLPTVMTMLFIAALISVAIGTMNLMPIPALDGARLVFLVIEAIRRKPVSPEREGMVHMVGFVILMVLIVVIAVRDVVNLM